MIRDHLQTIQKLSIQSYDETIAIAIQKIARAAELELDASREVTEKVTVKMVPENYIHYGDLENEKLVVTAHKARVVIDE